MVAFSGMCRSLSRLAKGTVQHYRNHEKAFGPSYPVLAVSRNKSQAVSDGELNMTARGNAGSSCSLPGAQAREAGQAKSVLGWAVCFERLLEDPTGVKYFTAFLRSEVSAENILFWQACQNFQKIPVSSLRELKEEARSIFQTYLSDSAPYSVNIDDTARTEETDLEQPSPDMFNKAQAQIFKLMKMDSYRRFVRSQLYQSCSLASVEHRPLPSIPSETTCSGSWENMAAGSPSLNNSKKKKKTPDSRDKRREQRGSWGVEMPYPTVTVSRKESQMSVKSTSSVELGSLFRQIENGRNSPRSLEQGDGGGCLVEGGYCCLYLPDGSASLAPTRPGLLLRDMLAALCEKRGFPPNDVSIYLHGNDKQPLSLDQDCSVLRDQQVSLELRVTFVLEVLFTGKAVMIKVKSSKTLQDALSMVLQKHQLKPQDAVVTLSGSDRPLDMNTSVFRLANKTLHLDKGKDQSSRVSGNTGTQSQGKAPSPAGPDVRLSPQVDRTKAQPKPSKNRDMEGLIEMLSRAQCCRVEDQRGLLTKEHLELPLFLQLPSAQGELSVLGKNAELRPQESENNNNNNNNNKPTTSGGSGAGQTNV